VRAQGANVRGWKSHTRIKWELLCTALKRRPFEAQGKQDRRTPKQFQLADPNIAVAHWMIVACSESGNFPGQPCTAGAYDARQDRSARRNVNFMLYYFGRNVRPKAGDSSRFFYFRHPSSASARIFRGTTLSCLPDHPHRIEVMRPCLPVGAGAA
jgi:hypothetical protein